MGLLDSVLGATTGGVKVIREENDGSMINWRNARGDLAEAVKRGKGETMVTAANRRAGLSSRNGKIAMVSALVVPWHELGKVVDGAMTSKEACELGGLAGWDLKKLQQWIDFNGAKIATDMWAIVRGDTGKVLGSVGTGYHIVSNEEVFSLMDAIMGEAHAKYETAGALGDGQVAWMMARMPENIEVARGDVVEPYMMCSTSHDGSGAIRIFPQTSRVECKNTLRLAKIGGRGKGISLKHTTNVKSRVDEARRVLGMTQKSLETFKDQSHYLVKHKLEPAEYFQACLDDVLSVTVADHAVTQASIKDGSVLDAILDMQDVEAKATERKRYERALERRTELLDDILERHDSERCNGMKSIAGSAWSAFNAVSEHIDHSSLWRANNEADSRFTRVMLGAGDDAKQEAWNRALKSAV